MRLALLLAATLPLAAQTARKVTLADAESIAIRNHPRVEAARLAAQAARESITQARAPFYPMLAGNLTGSVADHGSRLGAGNLNPSSLFSRTAAGVNVTQMLFDFGRTSSLTASARSRASAQAEAANSIRAEIVLRVHEAYIRALLARRQSIVARETLEARRVTLKQVSALTQSSLRSTLDLSFAELSVLEAELALERAQNERRASMIAFSAALGYTDEQPFELAELPDPMPLVNLPDSLVEEAVRIRPDLAALRLQADSARRFADSERRQSLPTFSAAGTGGVFGPRDPRLQSHYGAIGINLNIPVFNGSLFESRRREAELRAEVLSQDVRDLTVRVSHDVRSAWIDASNAQKMLAVTGKMVDQAARTLRLAQSRYRLGLSSIVELNQAQLSQTVAEVTAASARYDYLLRRSVLNYHTGELGR